MSKIVRYSYGGGAARFGELRGAKIQPLRGAIGSFSQADEPSVDTKQVRLLAPTTPSKVVAIGPGYRVHLKGGPAPARPHYWIKPASALLDPEGTIELPSGVPMVCHESEVAVVIGKVSKDVPIGRAHEHIFGYTCINDVTAGNMVNIPEFLKSQYFVDGKMFDTFCPLGPCIETELSLDNLELECRVNGAVRQHHNTSDLLFSATQLVSMISAILTLNPGDAIATGSPPGMGPLVDGDVVEVEVQGIGVLRNHVRAKSVPAR